MGRIGEESSRGLHSAKDIWIFSVVPVKVNRREAMQAGPGPSYGVTSVQPRLSWGWLQQHIMERLDLECPTWTALPSLGSVRDPAHGVETRSER